jgi:hypothetical protein
MVRQLDYAGFMRRAMHGLIRDVLEMVARDGLPGDHHFYVTFSTLHPDAEISDALSDRYPEEMTIVLQHEYERLEIAADGFSVVLRFGGRPEPLYVPFDAVKTFVDPSVSFGLQLEAEAEAAEAEPAAAEAPSEPEPERKGDAEVVSLDKFRK